MHCKHASRKSIKLIETIPNSITHYYTLHLSRLMKLFRAPGAYPDLLNSCVFEAHKLVTSWYREMSIMFNNKWLIVNILVGDLVMTPGGKFVEMMAPGRPCVCTDSQLKNWRSLYGPSACY